MGTTISTPASKIACKQAYQGKKKLENLQRIARYLSAEERGSLQWEWICTCTKRGSRENED